MDIDLPGAAAAQPGSPSLEEELAIVFKALLEDTGSAQQAVWNTYYACLGRAEALRVAAAEQLHRPARHMALNGLAEEMEAQAATWQLLFCLYCDQSPPAGGGGSRVEDAGDAALYRQRLADAVGNDAELSRCARVVAWLESLADDALKRQGTVAFAPGEGLWHETKTEMRTRADRMVSELDPDAPGRSGRSLHPSNSRSQERILARVWQLIRAGNLSGAQELCRQVGQPWRAAALGGGGLYGALPVGVAAVEHDDQKRHDLQAEELADEVTHGSGTMLALWRWAAQQAATAPPGDKFERAVFGALGGSTAASAACASWEDFAWVYCRSWLESQAMRAVPPQPQPAGDLVAGDAVLAALVRCGVAPAVAQRSIEGAMSVVMGGGGGAAAAAAAATMPVDADAAAVAAASRGFGQLFGQHVMSPAALATSGSTAVQALRQVQGLLVQGDVQALAHHLFATLIDRRGGGGAGDADGMEEEEGNVGFGSGAAPAASNPERRRRTCALAAHLLLALGGLGVLPRDPTVVERGPFSLEAHNTLDLVQRLFGFYTGMLLDQGQLSLVPPYLCVLRPRLRSSLCGELLELHTRRLTGVDVGGTDGAVADASADEDRRLQTAEAECLNAVQSLDFWFGRCVERQQKPDSERSSLLETDIRKDELRIQLTAFTLACRHNRDYGPHQRARVARWLVLPHIMAAREAAAAGLASAGSDKAGEGEAEDGGGGETVAAAVEAAARLDPWTYYDVLDFVNCLCCEFALGDNVTAAAGHLLFEEVLPEGLELAAEAAAGSLEAAAAAATEGAPVRHQQDELDGQSPESLFPEAATQLAAQLRVRASELANWRLYFHLDAKLAAWTERREAREQARAKADAEDALLLQDGGALLQELLLLLLQFGWQQPLATADSALAAAAVADGVVRVGLTVTCPPGSSSVAAGTAGSPWGQPTAPYPELQGAALLEFQQALDSGLRRAAAERGVPAVGVEVEPQGHGHVTLSLEVTAEHEPWQGLVELVSGLVRGELEGVPPLLLVSMEADRATSLAVCRRCCIGQAVIRCASLRLSLVALGADAESPTTGPQLVELLAAPAEASGVGLESGLLELLSTTQLDCVLQLEADTHKQHMRNMQGHRHQQRVVQSLS